MPTPKRALLLPMTLCLLSATGCASGLTPCKPQAIPPLPESVVSEAKHSSTISDDVQTWLRSAQSSFEEKTRP